ncbi:MAG: YfhO family protein [Candidatus Hydrogenedentes bacterium]|nr:YfhO family protein [Candidatus Hydrogenedentota bacterium]
MASAGRDKRACRGRVRALGVCVPVLVLAIGAVYGHVVQQWRAGATPGMFDVGHYFVPMGHLLGHSLHNGEAPLWNPLSFCGMPFAANPQAAAFYPPHVVRSLITRSPTPLDTYFGMMIVMALHVLAAGTGTFFLARSHRMGYAASLAASFAFIFSVAFTRRVLAYHYVPSVAWLPFILIAVRSGTRAPGTRAKLLFAIGAGLLLALSILAGFVQIEPYLVLFVAAYAVLSRVCSLTREDIHEPRAIARALAVDAGWLAVALVIAGLACAALFVPAMELSALTSRAKAGEAVIGEMALVPSQVILSLFGRPSGAVQFGLGYFKAAGIGAYVLAVAAFFGRRRRDAFLFTALLLLFFDCSLGLSHPVARLVDALAPFRMQHPQRAFLFACLPLGLLAGLGVEAASGAAGAGVVRSKRRWWYAAAVAASGAVLIALSQLGLADPLVHVPAVIAVGVLAAPWLARPRLTRGILAGLVFVECLLWNLALIPEYLDGVDRIDIRRESAAAPSRLDGNRRTCELTPNRHLLSLRPAVNGYDPLYLRPVWELITPPEFSAVYERVLGAEDVVSDNLRAPLLLKRSFWLTRTAVRGALPGPADAFPPTTTVFVDTEGPLPLPETARDQVPGRCVSDAAERVPLPPPRQRNLMAVPGADGTAAWSVELPEDGPVRHSALVVRYASMSDARMRVHMPEPDTPHANLVGAQSLRATGGAVAEVEVPLPELGTARVELAVEPAGADSGFRLVGAFLLRDRADEDGLIRVVSRTMNTAELDVGPIDGDRVLVFLDAAYPGWRATVDGERVEVLTVDNAFKGVHLGPGRHRVRFTFHSPSAAAGMAVSISALAAVSVALACLAMTRRKPGAA